MTRAGGIITEPKTWTKSQLVRYVGGLSNPSKMPGFGYSLPAQECVTGRRLRRLVGTVCSKCYALKGRYKFPRVKSAMYFRLERIGEPLWVAAMAELINRTGNAWFRWHDSGDLQSIAHLRRIIEVCEATPSVNHWLPTREYRMVKLYIENGGKVPVNLNIRLSAHKIDGEAPAVAGTTGSTVSSADHRSVVPGHHCPAHQQGNFCGSCRACWDKTVPLVDYPLH